MNLLNEALTYLDMGWAVYPVHSVTNGVCSCGNEYCTAPGKHPMGRWSDYQHRLPDKEEVETWFTAMPWCNIGMVTGQVSGVAVVDIDGSEGRRSAASMDLPDTLSARTGGGGLHFFYSAHGPVRSSVRIRDGIDIRGDGGFVVLPPSLHASGKHYDWLDPRRLAPYPEIKKLRGGPSGLMGRSAANWSDDLIVGVSEGARSCSAARLVGRYVSLGLSLEEVWLLISGWNERNRPPMDYTDLRRTVEAVHRRHSDSTPARIETLAQIRSLLDGGTDD